jgi:hypothetical protein
LFVADVLPASLDLSGTDSSALYPTRYHHEQDNKLREFWLPPTSLYPYFLLPPTLRSPHATNTLENHLSSVSVKAIPDGAADTQLENPLFGARDALATHRQLARLLNESAAADLDHFLDHRPASTSATHLDHLRYFSVQNCQNNRAKLDFYQKSKTVNDPSYI